MNNPFLTVWKRSVTYKIFLVTLVLLIVSAALIYAALYIYLPSLYEKNKLNLLNEKVEQLTQAIENQSLKEAKTLIDEMANQTNSLILLNDSMDQVVHISSLLPTSLEITSKETSVKSGVLQPNRQVDRGFVSTGKSPTAGVLSMGDSIGPYIRKIPIALADQNMTLTIIKTLQPINEASRVMSLFIPNISIITLVVSLIGAYIYSRIIARPLIRINQAAQKMANLEFSTIIKYSSSDEMGQLSKSLNEMSANLQQAMNNLHHSNEQLKIEMKKEREIEDQRRRLFAMISHELKSPLTAVKGQLEGMIHGFGAYKDRDKYLKRSNEILDQMEQFIYDILQISKLEQHTFLPKLEKINLSEIINDSITKAAFFAGQKKIQLVSNVIQQAIITADQQLLEKAIYNIIHNGIAHSDSGERVNISLLEDCETRLFIFTVLNSGSRIPDQRLHKVFDPFYRAEESRSRNNGGSGLGLFLVKSVFEVLSIEYSLQNIPEGVLFRANFKSSDEKFT